MNDREIFINGPDDGSPETWDRYLAEACGDDAELRARVEALKEAASNAETAYLQRPAWQESASAGDGHATRFREIGEGSRIGNYKLLERIGAGGMGVVYLADELGSIRRRVAVKILRSGLDGQSVARFEAERQALALMDHPNIAKIFAAGATENGSPYFVMELVVGMPITKYCDQENLNPTQRLELFIDVCNAVQHAHQKGIIHRDLKPANVMVAQHDDQAVVKVIDFGIAKAQSELTDKTLFTRIGQLIGTPAYMSPEQVKHGTDIDTRSDIYSLGVLLYELLTGAPPFDPKRLGEAAEEEIWRVIREEEPEKPSTRLSTMDDAQLLELAKHCKLEPRKLSLLLRGDLDWIVMKAMEKDRSRRYESATGFAEDIGRFLRREPVLAAAPSMTYRLGKFVRRHRTTVAVATTIVLLLVAGIFGTTLFALQAHESDRRTRENFRKYRFAEASGKLELLPVTTTAGRSAQAVAALREIAGIEVSREIRDLAISNLTLPDIRPEPVKSWDGFPAGSQAMVFDPRLERYAICDADGAIAIRECGTGRELQPVVSVGQRVERLIFDAEAKRLAVWSRSEGGDGGALGVFEIASGKQLLERAVGDEPGAVDFSPDGRWIAFGVGGLSVVVQSLADGQRSYQHVMERVPSRIHFQPTGELLAIESYESLNLFFLNWRTGERPAPVYFPNLLHAMVWHPGGDLICAAPIDSPLAVSARVADGNFGEPTSFGQGTIGITQLAFSSAGSYLVTSDLNHGLKLLDASSGREIVSLPTGAGDRLEQLQLSPGDQPLAASRSGSALRLWAIEPGREVYRLNPMVNRQRRPTQVAFDSSGRVLMLTSDLGVQLWDWQHRRHLGSIEVGPVDSMAWNPSTSDLVLAGARGGMRVQLELLGDVLKSGTLRLFDAPPPLAGPVSLGMGDGLVAFVNEGAIRSFGSRDFRRKDKWATGYAVAAIAVHPQTGAIAVIDQHRQLLKILDPGTQVVEEVKLHAGRSLCFSPDGDTLIVGEDAGYQIYATSGWTPGRRFPHASGLRDTPVAITADGKLAAWSTGAKAVAIVSLAAGEIVAHLPLRDSEPASSLAFSPSGRELAIAGRDQRVEVWDLAAIDGRLREFGLGWAGGPEPASTAAGAPAVSWLGRGNSFDLRSRGALESDEGRAANPDTSGQQRGKSLHRLREYAQAAVEFEAVLAGGASSSPRERVDLLEWLADCSLRNGSAAEAYEQLDRAYQIDETYRPVVIGLVKLCLLAPVPVQNLERGHSLCQLLDEPPEGWTPGSYYMTLYCQAANDYQLGRYAGAREKIEEAIAVGVKLNYPMIDAHFLKAICLFREWESAQQTGGDADQSKLYEAEKAYAEAARRRNQHPAMAETHPIIRELRKEASKLLGHPLANLGER